VDLFRTTAKVEKTQQVVRIRGERCRDIELTTYLPDTVGSVDLVLDQCLVYDRWGSSSNPLLTCSVSATLLSTPSSNLRLVTSSPRSQTYGAPMPEKKNFFMAFGNPAFG
jgi:hypothetical protein